MVKVKMAIDLVTEWETSPAQVVGTNSLEDVVQAEGRIEWGLWMTVACWLHHFKMETTSKFGTHRYKFSLNILSMNIR